MGERKIEHETKKPKRTKKKKKKKQSLCFCVCKSVCNYQKYKVD